MRGPSVRLKYDVRRQWRCPRCGAERRVPATETTVRCACEAGTVQMTLVEPRRYARGTPQPLDLVMTEADCDAANPAEGTVEETTVAVIVEETAQILSGQENLAGSGEEVIADEPELSEGGETSPGEPSHGL